MKQLRILVGIVAGSGAIAVLSAVAAQAANSV